jgi:large subunit ribosomal protein L30
MTQQATITVKLVASPISSQERLRRVVRGLGLKKINQVAIKPDTPGFRGMVAKVPHLVKIISE